MSYVRFCRVFVRVFTSASHSKLAASKKAMVRIHARARTHECELGFMLV